MSGDSAIDVNVAIDAGGGTGAGAGEPPPPPPHEVSAEVSALTQSNDAARRVTLFSIASPSPAEGTLTRQFAIASRQAATRVA